MIVVFVWVCVAVIAVLAVSGAVLTVRFFSDGMDGLGCLSLLLTGLCVWTGIYLCASAVNGPLYECDYVESSPGVYVEQCERVR